MYDKFNNIKKRYEATFKRAYESVDASIKEKLIQRKEAFDTYSGLTCGIPAQILNGSSSYANAALCQAAMIEKEMAWYGFMINGDFKSLSEGGW